MITISVCMIVKNEEAVLARCLNSLQGIADEIIIVDTGSDDQTKEIAARYTEQIYDYKWIDDFSDARNFAFSKAHMDYIYSADADEVLDEENRKQFLLLKQVLDSQVEIVQMYYNNQLEHGTVYNFDKEYRPKLYKRVRQFVWEEPVHEAVRLNPVVFDSDIAIMHLPQECHAKRDFNCYQKALQKDGRLSKKLFTMYARELFVSGELEDFLEAEAYFTDVIHRETLHLDELKMAQCVLARCAHLRGDDKAFLTMCLHNVADGKASAEVCYELGLYYQQQGDINEAYIWFTNAAFETESQCNIHYSGDWPLARLAECAKLLGAFSDADRYEELQKEWKVPDTV